MDNALIMAWANSNTKPMRIAAYLAAGIRDGKIKALPSDDDIATVLDASPRTAHRAKRLLAGYGIIKQDSAGRYYLPC